jgi:hypothetical protein
LFRKVVASRFGRRQDPTENDDEEAIARSMAAPNRSALEEPTPVVASTQVKAITPEPPQPTAADLAPPQVFTPSSAGGGPSLERVLVTTENFAKLGTIAGPSTAPEPVIVHASGEDVVQNDMLEAVSEEILLRKTDRKGKPPMRNERTI